MTIIDEDFSRDDDSKITQAIQKRATFSEAKLEDLKSRKLLRSWVSAAIGFIMCAQLIGLFCFLNMAFTQHVINETKWLFLGLFGSLFTETYGLTRLIVMWLFKDVPYKPDHESD